MYVYTCMYEQFIYMYNNSLKIIFKLTINLSLIKLWVKDGHCTWLYRHLNVLFWQCKSVCCKFSLFELLYLLARQIRCKYMTKTWMSKSWGIVNFFFLKASNCTCESVDNHHFLAYISKIEGSPNSGGKGLNRGTWVLLLTENTFYYFVNGIAWETFIETCQLKSAQIENNFILA